MDEASRCHRVGFMKAGRILIEDQPSALRALLSERVLELRGRPIDVLRRVAHQDSNVQDVAAFGDRLHLRIRPGTAAEVMAGLPAKVRQQGGEVTDLRRITPALEDVFIAISGGEFDAASPDAAGREGHHD
jgi:ABC-2 type transport system ATP-binding protein